MSITYLERCDPDRNMSRFYAVTIVPTLFGEWSVVREWGRIGSPGTVREDWLQSEGDAEIARASLVLQKTRRGYSFRSSSDDGNNRAYGQDFG